MTRCQYSRERLQAWLDGEADRRAAETRDHLEHCRECAALVASWQRTGEELRARCDQGVGEVDSLVALQRIRARVARAEQRSIGARLRSWWQEAWLFHRRAVTGVAVAAALGALAAPGLVYLVGALQARHHPLGPAVVVESLEVGDNSTAVVLGGDGEMTTLIWVESGSNGESSEESF